MIEIGGTGRGAYLLLNAPAFPGRTSIQEPGRASRRLRAGCSEPIMAGYLSLPSPRRYRASAIDFIQAFRPIMRKMPTASVARCRCDAGSILLVTARWLDRPEPEPRLFGHG